MAAIEFKLSGEDTPGGLAEDARRAGQVGFSIAAIFDHYHSFMEAAGLPELK